MLEFKNDNGSRTYWTEYKATKFRQPKIPTLIGYDIRINGTVYTKVDEEFLEVFNKELAWEKLGA